MPDITTGQFPVNSIAIKVQTAQSTFSTIADMESAAMSIENNVETWYSMTDDGWQNAMLTAKALKMEFSGKRTLGDAGNDYIADLAFKIGSEAEADFEIEFPNGDKLTFTGVVSVNDYLVAEASNVAPLSFTVDCKGKPTYTAYTAPQTP